MEPPKEKALLDLEPFFLKIQAQCKKYEELGAGRYGNPELAGRYLFDLSRDVQKVCLEAKRAARKREGKAKGAEVLGEEFQRVFDGLTQGSCNLVPVSPESILAKLRYQDRHIRELELALAAERESVLRLREEGQKVLEMHQASARRAAKIEEERCTDQLKALAAKVEDEQRQKAALLAEAKDEVRSREFTRRDVARLEHSLESSAEENARLRDEVARCDSTIHKAICRARDEAAALLKTRELFWKHELHTLQAKANAVPETVRIQDELASALAKKCELEKSAEHEIGALKRKTLEQARLIGTLKMALVRRAHKAPAP